MEAYIQHALLGGQLSIGLVLIVFCAGLVTSFTPCIYPMLPITVGIVGRSSNTRLQAFGHALLYVLGVALVYAALGMTAALTGQLFGSVASHPVTLALVALMLLILGLWMLDWLRLPNWFGALEVAEGKRPRLLALFFTGGLSGLVMAPCTSPVLGLLLMFVAARGEPVWGALLMFVFAFGMCALLIVAGTFSGLLARLPRAGRWMNGIKIGLAALILLAGGYFGWLAIQTTLRMML